MIKKIINRLQLGLLLVVLLLLCGRIDAHINIYLYNSISWTITSANLQGGAGTDLVSSYESASNAMRIEIKDAQDSDTWTVDIKKTDVSWHGNLHLWARRTSNGEGNGTISGGTAYQEITNIDYLFFTGKAERNQVSIQLKVTGVSVHIPVASYSTYVYCTVIDTY
jgi:hypothetical protein